jgi:HD-like signal output (HDOD) protein
VKLSFLFFNDIALRINRDVRENKLDADLICEILEEDLALVAELLRLANSGYRGLADEAFICGLLHDIDKLSLICIMEDLIEKEGVELSDEIVNSTTSAMYCSRGVQLLEAWNLPEEYKTVVLQQNSEEFDQGNTVLTIIRLVDKACVAEGIADMDYENIVDVASMQEAEALSLIEQDLHGLSLILQEVKGVDAQQAA